MVDIRLFIALNFPDSILDKIAGITREVEANSLRGRFVERQNIHLTLEFLGEVGEDRMPLIKKVIDRLEYAPFSLFLGKIGYFKREDGSVCWIGVERNETLLSLQEQLTSPLKAAALSLRAAFSPRI